MAVSHKYHFNRYPELIIFRFREKICITMPYYVSTSITLDAEDEELATPSAARLLLYSYVQRNMYKIIQRNIWKKCG
ncbi:hypothetical protein T08_15672 [Trichinella sp. T8]|nr:hypothetical protein T08_15672 [Trichinella sp. T8]